jgi:acyl-coenzyme A thioesterase PaaI-like protein
MEESFRTRLARYYFNLFPAYRRTGGRVTAIAADWSAVRVAVPHNLRTRNYMGTIFGGSLYGAVDPIYAMMLIKRLGDGYEVWDKAARIEFRKPGRERLTATFRLSDEEVAAVAAAVEETGRTDRHYDVDLVDSDGVVHAHVEKTVHVRRKVSTTREDGGAA